MLMVTPPNARCVTFHRWAWSYQVRRSKVECACVSFKAALSQTIHIYILLAVRVLVEGQVLKVGSKV